MRIKTSNDFGYTHKDHSYVPTSVEVFSGIDAIEDLAFPKEKNYCDYFMKKYGKFPTIFFVWDPYKWNNAGIPLFDNIRKFFPEAKIFLYMNDCHPGPTSHLRHVYDLVDKIGMGARIVNVERAHGFLPSAHKFLFTGPACNSTFFRPDINWKSENKILYYGMQYENRKILLNKLRQNHKNMLVEVNHPLWTNTRYDNATKSSYILHCYSYAFTTPADISQMNPNLPPGILYLVEKIFEIMGSGVLLLYDDSTTESEIKELGLLAGVHYVSFTPSTVDQVMKWLTDPANGQTIKDIRQAGHAMVKGDRLVKNRVAMMNQYMLDNE